MTKKEQKIDIEDRNAPKGEEQEEIKDTVENETQAPADNEETPADKKAGEPETEEGLLAKAQEENARLKDQLLRTAAEFENYKKRTLKEKTELILNGGEKTITAILPVLDDMERAVANADKAESIEAVEEGWELIFKKLLKTLESMGVKKMDTQGKDFDVDYHEAIAMVPGMGDDKKGKVVDCVQTGYMLNDKVIRHAKVAVGQ
ncbi:nucleotide exchange factor GrpE [Prevotella sp. oral taxon 376]|uniref:nucleotide exchange factor GrpE n=1 Tax=Prevotella sp. oral taxon 376 TaxID=712466 RepID=UPI000D1D8886|nr:nucleotide exchange factor GrpE [Prevotella sp. oral taxon 376]PTL33190.1 nucleotide exchange factor GrpE [Prevotella sp. oral taxon 376]